MEKNLNFRWEEQVKRLRDDVVYAKEFTKFILSDTLQEDVDVESVSVHVQKSKGNEENKVEIVVTIVVCGFKRTMEILLYKNGCIEHDKSFRCCYYCVEAPSILLDSGRTSMNLEVREDLLERWNLLTGK